MPILGILASSKLTAAAGDYESIATVTVGSGGASTVTFSSIGTDWTHLQLRGLTRGTIAQDADQGALYVNSDTASNYTGHYLYGTGSSVGAEGYANLDRYYGFDRIPGANATSGIFGVFVMDILDYKNTNKFKTFRTLGGYDANGSGQARFTSGLWRSTSAITSITLYVQGGGNYAQHSHFALYGIKSA